MTIPGNTCSSLNVPMPKKETLSRHSLLGPNGLQGQWLGPSPEIKVKFLGLHLILC